MVEAALQFATDPTAKLLTNHPIGAGLKQIEKWIKPASFSAANPLTPGITNKRARFAINCNVTPGKDGDQTPTALPRNAPRGTTRGGRGGYNRKYRPAPNSAPQARGPPPRFSHHARPGALSPNPNEAFVMTGPAYRTNNAPRLTPVNSPAESRIFHSEPPVGSQMNLQSHSPTPSRSEATSSTRTAQ